MQEAISVEIVEADGMVREPTLRYYADRARGGARDTMPPW